MNIALILGLLALFNIFCTSVRGDCRVWPLLRAEIGNRAYDHTDQLSLERDDHDGSHFVIYMAPKNFASNQPDIIYGPFKLRGFGPYSMLITKLWLNTTGGEKYVTVTFLNIDSAREFYHVSNPHHARTFPNGFKVERLVLESTDGMPTLPFQNNVPKALDSFVLETSTGVDSRARSLVVHNRDNNQEPILIFHSTECRMTVSGKSVMLSIAPLNSRTTHLCNITLESSSAAEELMRIYTTLNTRRCENNLQDLEALLRNTYPSRPPSY